MKIKILKITGLALLILIGFAWAAPYLFKGKITQIIQSRINKDLKAHVHFTDLSISWFRHFPQISLGLENLQVVCVGEFDADTLLKAKELDIACHALSLVSGDSISIYSITLNEPQFHGLIHKNGHSNWDMLKSRLEQENSLSSARPVKWDIERYALHNAYINYEDESRDIHIEFVNLDHEARGNFAAELFKLKTKTSADAIKFSHGGSLPYQLTAKTSINMAFDVENSTHTYSFNTEKISFNDLKLKSEGFFQWINDSSYNMDIKFGVPSTEFKNLLSMLPSVYQKDFASVKSAGQVVFNGYVRGKYNKKQAPAYHVNLDIKNGFFQYPDLPVAVEHINLKLHVDNPDGIADHITVNIPQGHIEANDDSLNFHLLVRNPRTKPYIDLGLAGRLDLGNVSKMIKLSPGTRLAGILSTNINARGIVPGSEKQKKDPFQSGGAFDLRNFSYFSNAYPGGIALNDLSLTFNPKNVLINELKGVYLSTNFNATGAFGNLFAFALKNEPLVASMHIKADELNLRDWMRPVHDSNASAHGSPPFAVPDNIDFAISAEAGKLHYDDLDMQQVSGNILISDETVQLDQINAEAMEGTLIMNGTYSTKEVREIPEINFTYDVKGLDVQKTFFAFNTLQKLMPVGKFLSGKFSAQMSLAGKIGQDMAPDLQSLHGKGSLLLMDGIMKDFGPLDKLSQSLDLSDVKDMPMNDVKADFSYKNGKVAVSPFLIQSNHLELVVSGTHSFDQTLDYSINLKVPRNQLGNKGSEFVKNVVTDAADKGIPVKLRDAVSMNVKMSGTINTPDVKTDMNSMVDNAAIDLKKEVNEFVNAKLDSAKHELHHPSSNKKPLIVQAAYKSKGRPKAKKSTGAAHKNEVHSKTKKKHKAARKYYTASMKKAKSTAKN
ncbi:MAG TPA: AsmA-like C-terminal region-containing protein [Puia sp.]|nr:AsmA-like C-terminal region-containing protein [Puia sp.]